MYQKEYTDVIYVDTYDRLSMGPNWIFLGGLKQNDENGDKHISPFMHFLAENRRKQSDPL